ncbi:recombinase family protein [Nonomuraea sp. NPDC048826]|uniref:recombinase family protein n=1 Tax=Nonomuraea sp. NPDC048826 TaxID=3364347 RepID=UPI003711FDF0
MIGYARCSTVLQDPTARREILTGLGVAGDRICLDEGLTGTNRARPGLDQALAAVRAGDTLVVPKLDRLARSAPDARDIGDTLVAQRVRLSLGGSMGGGRSERGAGAAKSVAEGVSPTGGLPSVPPAPSPRVPLSSPSNTRRS